MLIRWKDQTGRGLPRENEKISGLATGKWFNLGREARRKNVLDIVVR